MPTSVYYSVLQAIETQVSGLSLTIGSTTLPVDIRKLPKVEETLDTVPLIIVCPSEEPEEIEPAASEGYVYVTYKVEIVLVAAGNQDMVTNLDSYLSCREQIRNLFQGTTLSGVSTVFDLDVDPEVPIDREAVNSNYDYSALAVKVKSCELRGL